MAGSGNSQSTDELPRDETGRITVVRARHLVESLSSALARGESGLRVIPGLMKVILEEGSWREREIRTKKIVRFERFIDFVVTPPLEGLGEKPDLLKRLLQDDPAVLADYETALVGKAGNPTGANQYSDGISSITTNSKTVDRGRAYTLRRLKANRPDLFAKVEAKELSAHAAAIEAGFRIAPPPLTQLRRSWKKATSAERATFLAEVQEQLHA